MKSNMTTKKKTKAATTQKTRWGRVASVWALALTIVLFGIDRQEFPTTIASAPAVKTIYQWRDGAVAAYGDWAQPLAKLSPENKAARIEPAAGENAGYKDDDRKELDSLISRGPYNQ